MFTSRFAQFGRHISEDYSKHAHVMEYNGTVAQLVEELKNPTPEQFALHPSRILRGALEYKIARKPKDAPQFIQQVASIVHANYITDNYFLLTSMLAAHPKLAEQPVLQPFDQTTWDASTQNRCEKTAEILVDTEQREKDICFIPLGHGSLASALEIYSHFVEKTNSHSFMYPIRYSRLKKRDVKPQLEDSEVAYLQEALQHVTPVIYDEDITSGKTTAEAFLHFRNTFLPNKPVIVLSNRGEKSYRVRMPEEWQSLFDEYGL